jgi:hypothetical protein
VEFALLKGGVEGLMMKIQWTNMSGFGLSAWHHEDPPLVIPSMVHHHEEKHELQLHPHDGTILQVSDWVPHQAHHLYIVHHTTHDLPYHLPKHITHHNAHQTHHMHMPHPALHHTNQPYHIPRHVTHHIPHNHNIVHHGPRNH